MWVRPSGINHCSLTILCPAVYGKGHLLDTPQSDKGTMSGGGLDAAFSRVQMLTDVSVMKKDADKTVHSSGEKENRFLLTK